MMQNKKISLNLVKSFLEDRNWIIGESPMPNLKKAFNDTLGLKLYIPSDENIEDYEEIIDKLLDILSSIYSKNREELINKILLKEDLK